MWSFRKEEYAFLSVPLCGEKHVYMFECMENCILTVTLWKFIILINKQEDYVRADLF